MTPLKRKSKETHVAATLQLKRSKKVDDNGWNSTTPGLIYKEHNAQPGSKLACFDLDQTLIQAQKKTVDDWKFYNKSVPEKLRCFVEEGFKIVIFSNQNSIKSATLGKAAERIKRRIDSFLEQVDLPMQVFLAPQRDRMRKPEKGMWDYFCTHCNGGTKPDMDASFYVGDAAGRPGDFAASDKEFAAGIGLKFKVPEDVFGEEEGRIRPADPSQNKNPDLTKMFEALAQDATKNGGDKAHFKVAAFRKVSKMLASFPDVICEENLKEVGKLKGVGKESVSKIREFLQTGTCKTLESNGSVALPDDGNHNDKKDSGVPSKSLQDAMKFL